MDPSIEYITLSLDKTYFLIQYKITTQGNAITAKGVGTLMEAINYMYGTISAAPAATRNAVAKAQTDSVTRQLRRLKPFADSEFSFVLVQNGDQLIGINPRFEYRFYDTALNLVLINKSFSWPKYANVAVNNFGFLPQAELKNIKVRPSGIRVHKSKKECCLLKKSDIAPNASGIIRFTPEFNVDTQFDNANFYRAQNDNFTEKIRQFVNAPAFNRALFLRPKAEQNQDKGGCKHCDCDSCYKKRKEKKKKNKVYTTTANDLLQMVTAIYQISTAIQNNEITWQDGSEQIIALVEAMQKYEVKGARSVFYLGMQDQLIYIQFINRYNLPQSDCVVAFTVDGAKDFTNDAKNDVILSVSEVPVDEDMAEAIYSPVTGIFAYGDVE